MASPLLYSLAGWAFLPDFITKQLLNFPPYRRFLTRLSSPYNYYRHTFAVVVLSYLTWSLCASTYNTEPNFYEQLCVLPSVDDSGLKTAFRRSTLLFHPDRRAAGHEEGDMFMRVRSMYEALKDPAKRFAYDRFGEDVLQCQTCSTPREYLNHGLLQSASYHVISLVFLVFWSAVGAKNSVSFWRYLLFTTLLLLEVSLIFSTFPIQTSDTPFFFLPSLPDPSTLDPSEVASSVSFQSLLHPPISKTPISSLPLTILAVIFPSRVPYQHVKLLHQLLIFFSIALSRVAPVLFPSTPTDEMAVETGKLLLSLTKTLELEARGTVQNMIQMIKCGPCESDIGRLDTGSLSLLTTSMEEVLVEDAVARDIPDTWKQAKVSAEEKARLSEAVHDQQLDDAPSGQSKGVALPSPRPSPPPLPGTPVFRRMESYGRARSISC